MPNDTGDATPLDYATPRNQPPRAPSLFVAVGHLLIPAIILEVGFLGLGSEKFFAFGVILFPLGLSWLIAAMVRLSATFRR